MAKGSAMGLWKGKKGSSVFYKITNSNNGQKQGIRERVYDVSNPQTSAQAEQRMKLLPAQRIAGAIREIVERGWQGVEYGAKSRSSFLSAALKMSSGYPYVNKSDDRIAPGSYQITKGTLSPIQGSFGENSVFLSDIIVDDPTDLDTVGDFSAAILDQSAIIKEGDQITVACCLSPDSSYQSADPEQDYSTIQFTWEYLSFYVNTNDETPFGDLKSGAVQIWYTQVGNYSFLSASPNIDGYTIMAAAFILSRDNGNGGFLRSSQKLVVNTVAKNIFNSTQRKAAARESYMKTESVRTSDWPVDPEGEGGSSDTYYNDYITLSGFTGNYSAANGLQALAKFKVSDNSVVGLYYVYDSALGSGQFACNASGTALNINVEMEAVGITLTMVKNAMPRYASAQEIRFQS